MRKTLVALSLAAACGNPHQAVEPMPPPPPAAKLEPVADRPPPHVRFEEQLTQALLFLTTVEMTIRRATVDASTADWANQTDLTPAHEDASAAASAELSKVITKLIKAARAFDPILAKLPPEMRRQLLLLKFAGQPAPDDPKQADELAKIAAEMTSIYGKGKVCAPHGKQLECKDLEQLSKVLEHSRDPREQLAVWQGWHDAVGHAERDLFAHYVELANIGARAVGFTDVASMWKSSYDMPEDAFEAETDRLWTQLKPLYTQLHCYTRRKLNTLYGDKIVGKTGPIPAHLTGNMWAQAWGWLYPELEPYKGVSKIDVGPALKKLDGKAMVKMGEAFYTSLGYDPLPSTFWERSLFAKPADKEVVCHASAWDVTSHDDLRIKMCIQQTQEDLVTIHHELGHDYYYHSYYALPLLYQAGANDGFQEAIGDTIALSMTPDYLKTKGLLDKVTRNDKATINQQMRIALDKVAFLPFGLMIDKWRWDVFSGKVKPDQYNQHWWDLRLQYEGISPPSPRAATDFDPGAKYHVATNTPYMRYFLAAVLQFQFHRALCKKAGFTGPLDECSIYGNKDAGEALWRMLSMGASKPWQDALFTLTGQRDMDATALLEYFAPLERWLEQQNQGQPCGW